MSSGFVPVDQLFLSEVIARNTNEDGSPKDPRLLARMQNPICQNCHETYQKKYPGRPFQIKCEGIYDDADYQEKHAAAKAQDPACDLTLEDVREVFDVVYWANKYIVVKDSMGDAQPFVARWYQEEVLRCTASHKVDRMGRGLGKALAIDTPIPSPSGWTTMNALQPGDQVFDEQGKICRVTFTTDVMRDHTCYDVVFSDGSVITADAEHQWETWDKAARKAARRYPDRVRPRALPQVRTTEQIRASLRSGGETNHAIRVAGPVQHEEQSLPIAPYVLGAWLGDGTSANSGFTCDDQEILCHIEQEGTSVRAYDHPYSYALGILDHQRNPRTGRMEANGSFKCKLRELRVLGRKHIPEVYLRASVGQRLALLQGLMDTDGNCREDGWSEFDGMNRFLCEQVRELVASLGMKPTWSEKEATIDGRIVGTAYRVGFFPTLPVFRLSRKAERVRPPVRPTVAFRYIVDVLPRASVAVKCIQVDSPSHLYLAGRSFIPTHNTSLGVIKELHKAMTNKNYEILVVCPAQSQSEKWFQEIKFQLENSPFLDDSLQQRKQQPYHLFRFKNGSTISIFTAGSKSGRGADSVRSQSPRRVRLDEQDYLVGKDYQAIMPLVRRYKNSEFHGSSTPTGMRDMFWQMCTKMPGYREFYYPISVHPDWGEDMEENCIREAKTMDRYRHEFLAEFGDPEDGVFKGLFVDAARRPYLYTQCVHHPGKSYFLGVDWNGQGTGTKLRVVEYDPETHVRVVVGARSIDEPGSTMRDSINAIIDLNRKWHCKDVFLDFGFGAAQDEMIRLVGQQATEGSPFYHDDRRLKDIRVIDFGANLEFNRLVSKRGNSKYLTDDDKLERRTKPFMVDGAVQAFESGLVHFSSEDDVIDEQLRAYRVKNWSNHGFANTYEAPAVGDHDLDALLLALLACEMRYGLFQSEDTVRHLAQVFRVGGWGMPSPGEAGSLESSLTQKRDYTGVPSRSQTPAEREKFRIQYVMRNGAYVAPTTRSGNSTRGEGQPGSRTSMFRRPPNRRNPFGF